MFNLIHPNRIRAKDSIDGKQQKKRGPKTDSKPALNSKQEKNRQAQRYAFPSLVMYFLQVFLVSYQAFWPDIHFAGIERASMFKKSAPRSNADFAHRNHRERVAAYTMTVEKEANRAREALRLTEHHLTLATSENATLAEENRKLTHQNGVLTQLLRVNNIGVPNFSTTPLSANSQQGPSRMNGSHAVTEATHPSNQQQGSPYGGNSNSSQNALGGFSPNGSGVSPASSGYPFAHGGIMHEVGAHQNGFSGASQTSPSSGNNPYAQDFAGNHIHYSNESAFGGAPYANTNYDSPYASTNHNSSQTHAPTNQFEARSMPQQSHAFTQGHAHPTPAPSTQTPYGNAASPYANTHHHSNPEDPQVNQFQVQSMQMQPPNGPTDYQAGYPAMITSQSPYYNNDSSDQQTPIPEAAPYGPISFTTVSKYEASHPAEVAQWRLLMPDIEEPEMTREFAIPFILEYVYFPKSAAPFRPNPLPNQI